MDVIDLIAADDDNDDDEPINLLDSDDERTERVQNQPSSTTIPSSKNASQHTNKSALRNVRHPSSSGNQQTAQANRSSAWSEPVQQPSPSKGLPLGSGQQARAGFGAPACQPGTASKALHQHSIVSADVKATLASGSFDAKSALPSASTAAQPSLPPPAPLATLRQQQQQPAAHQLARTRAISTHPAASSQQQAPPSDDGHPAVSSPGRGPQHPPPLLRDIHAQRQAAAKTDDQVAQQTALAAQQPAQVHSASPMEQMACQVIASRQAAQNQGTKGDCLHHAKVRQSS